MDLSWFHVISFPLWSFDVYWPLCYSDVGRLFYFLQIAKIWINNHVLVKQPRKKKRWEIKYRDKSDKWLYLDNICQLFADNQHKKKLDHRQLPRLWPDWSGTAITAWSHVQVVLSKSCTNDQWGVYWEIGNSAAIDGDLQGYLGLRNHWYMNWIELNWIVSQEHGDLCEKTIETTEVKTGMMLKKENVDFPKSVYMSV